MILAARIVIAKIMEILAVSVPVRERILILSDASFSVKDTGRTDTELEGLFRSGY